MILALTIKNYLNDKNIFLQTDFFIAYAKNVRRFKEKIATEICISVAIRIAYNSIISTTSSSW
ncbi:MAG TPA: hypothetical protein DCQ28_10500 [Bacteroidetes bacterium]|nr:hypothetical protein [Bacteroidota bacterium]